MKKLMMMAMILVAAVAFADTRVIYVKPDGDATKDGTGGWAEATTLPHALSNFQIGDELRLSKGIHYVVTTWSSQPYNRLSAAAVGLAGITMKGGYAGESDNEEPTLDRYATIVSGDIGKDDVWMHVDPVTGVKEYLLNDGEPIYVLNTATGALNLPPNYTAEYDCYYPVQYTASSKTISETLGNNIQRFYCDNQGGKYTYHFENFTMTGFGSGTSTSAGFIDLSGTNTGIFKKLAVIGCNNDSGGILDNNATGTHEYQDIVMKHCRFWNTGGIQLRSTAGLCHVDGVVAEGIYGGRWSYSNRNPTGGQVITFQGAAAGTYVHNVDAKRIVYDGGAATAAEGANAALVMRLVYNVAVSNVMVRGCWSKSYGGVPIVMASNGGSYALDHLCFTNCKSRVKTSASASVVAGLVHFGDSNGMRFLTNSLFKDNELTVEATDAVNFLTVAPVVCRSSAAAQKLVSGCMFDNNVVSVTGGAETAEKAVSRALAYRIEGQDNNSTFTVVNCSFTGASTGSDLVFSRSSASVTGCKRTSFVLDSIFSSQAAGYIPVQAFEANHLAIRNCIAPGMDSLADVANVELSGDNYYYDPMLKYDAEKNALVPTVNVPGLMTSSAYYFQTKFGNGLVATNLCKVKMRYRSATIEAMPNQYASLLSTYDGRTKGESYGDIYADALGVARPDGAKTLGAVQWTDYPAGNIVVSTKDPAVGGTVSPASITATEGSVTLTATPAEGYSFSKWVDEDGNTLGTDASLVVTPEQFTHVKAVFGAPKTKITFSLDGKGTFTDNGQDTTVVEADAQTAFPSVPAFTNNTGWAATSTWTPAFPTLVPTEDTTYTLTFKKDFKAICFDTHATGSGDGSDWANACTDWATAMTLCATAVKSELRIKTGHHVITTTAVIVDGVQVKGGYTGEGETRTTNALETVLSGDVNGDDNWKYDDGSDGGLVYSEGAFNWPNADRSHKYQTLANTSDNTLQLIDGNITDWVCENGFGMDGFTATGFGQGATRGPVLSAGPYFGGYVVSNCVFIANNGMNGQDQGVIATGSAAKIYDCRFIGNQGTAVRGYNYANNYPKAWENDAYVDCRRTLFANGYAVGVFAHTAGFGVRFGSGAVADCTFRDNYAAQTSYYGPGAAIGFEGTALKWVLNCKFENNMLEKGCNYNGYATLQTVVRVSDSSWVSNCLFKANKVINPQTTDKVNYPTTKPCILQCGYHMFRNSFIDNYITATNASIAAVVMNARQGAAYGNCTFVSNRVENTLEGGVTALASNTLNGQNKFGFAQCTFVDNDVDAIATGHYDMTLGFGNCILWHREQDKVTPFKPYPGKSITGVFWSNTIKGYQPSEDTTITVGYDDEKTVNDDPDMQPDVSYSANGLNAYVLPHRNKTGMKGAGADVRYRWGMNGGSMFCQFLFQKANGKWDGVNEYGQDLTGTPLTWDLLGEGTCGTAGEYIRGSVQQTFRIRPFMLIIK